MKINWYGFGKTLRCFREDADLGLREAASDAGIDKGAWCRAENGKPVSAVNYLALCAWMEVHPFRYFK